MPRPRRHDERAARSSRRHGRGPRGPITGPRLPILDNRISRFEFTVAATVNYLKDIRPDQLERVRFEVAASPAEPPAPEEDGMRRWHVDRAENRIVLYRVPIQRLGHLHRNDAYHRRAMVESCVYGAVADYLGCDPWELAPRLPHGM